MYCSQSSAIEAWCQERRIGELGRPGADFAGVAGPKDYNLPGRSWLPLLEQTTATGFDQSFFSHTFHEVTMYYPMRGVRTRQHKYIHNLFPELEFPHASDLYASATWQSILRGGERAKVGQRTVGLYLHRAEHELYDIVKDPDEVNNLARDPAFASTLKTMQTQVKAWRKETKDPWLINDNYKPASRRG
jgi:N-sulfoglucosamine sulfohydrolase